MSISIKENERDARERLRAFWSDGSLGRPALYVTADNIEYKMNEWNEENTENKILDFKPEWHIQYNEEFLKSTIFLAEAMPCFTLKWGSFLTTVATLAGGDYEYHNSLGKGQYGYADSAWIKPIPDLFERELPRFDPQHPISVFLSRCISMLGAAINRRGYVNPPIMLDAMTTISMFVGPDELSFKIIDEPDTVKRWNTALTDIYIDSYDYFYSILKASGFTDTGSWLNIMAEGKFEAVQCDFATMISPDMFKEFVIPDLERVTDYMDFSLYHLDGVKQMRFIDLLSKLPKLNGIQWNPEPAAGSPVKWIDAFKEIRKRNLCLYVDCNDVEEAKQITRELGPDGLYIVLPRFGSTFEAEKAIKEIESVC